MKRPVQRLNGAILARVRWRPTPKEFATLAVAKIKRHAEPESPASSVMRGSIKIAKTFADHVAVRAKKVVPCRNGGPFVKLDSVVSMASV